MKRIIIIAAAVTAATAGVIACAGTVTPTPATPATNTSRSTHPARKAPTTIGDGIWHVPADVKAGTYTTKANTTGSGCYWARLRDFTGNVPGSIIANNNIEPGANDIITIKSSDVGVEFSGGCRWTRTGN